MYLHRPLSQLSVHLPVTSFNSSHLVPVTHGSPLYDSPVTCCTDLAGFLLGKVGVPILHMPPTSCTPTNWVASEFPALLWVTCTSLRYPLLARGFANSFLACCVNELLSSFNHNPTSSFPSLVPSYPPILTTHTLFCLVLKSQLSLPGSVHKVLTPENQGAPLWFSSGKTLYCP